MNEKTQLKIQSYLDGEASQAEAAKIAHLLTRDAEAQAIFAELQQTAAVLSNNETPAVLPDSRDFYWSKIERAIEQSERSSAKTSPRGVQFLLRWLAPVGALSALTLAAVFSASDRSPGLDEMESNMEEATVYSFRSQAEKMSVVWIHSDVSYEFTSPEFENKLGPNDDQ